MSIPFRAIVAPLVGLGWVLFAGELHAQAGDAPVGLPTPPEQQQPPPAGPAAPPKPAMTPPELKKTVEAVYPQQASEQGLEAHVEVEFVVNAEGHVDDPKVVQPVGNGFDEAALEAIRQYEFAPATKDNKPIKARMRLVIHFEQKPPPEPEPETPPPPPPARLEGRVLDADGDAALAGASVTVTAPNGARLDAQTDDQGHFAFPDLPEGTYTVHVEVKDRLPREQPEELHSGEVTDVVYRLQQPPDSEAFGATARIPPPPREVTRRTIPKEELTRIPGTRGDALRTVELMPGVARPPLGAGLLIVRGSAPYDTQALFEGLPVQLLYHFGGLTSFMNSRFIDSIDFIPGNFSVRYGRRRGAIIEVGAADLPRDKIHGVADVNVIDASIMASTPVGDDAELAAAFRRSYFDAVFSSALSGADISTIAAPVYYDYQVMGTYRPGPKDKLRLMAYGSSDKFALLFEQPADADAAVAGKFDLGTEFHRLHASWRHQYGDKVDQDTDIAVGYLNADLAVGEAFSFNLNGNDIYERSEWRVRVTDQVRLIAGIDVLVLPGDFTYSGPPVEQSEGNPGATGNGATFSNRDRITATDSFTVFQPAVYLETDLTLGPWLLILGSRADYFSEIRDYTYDPRGTVLYSLTESTKLKSGLGLFSQPPQFQESSPELGNKNLEATQTVHVDLGVDQTVMEGFTLTLDGFYKHMFDRVVGTAFGEPPYFTNDGQGRVYGLEFQLKMSPNPKILDARFFGYVSYTLSRSERRDHEGEQWELFDFDQTHILTVAAVYRLGRGWEAGVTFRLVSGNPDTPIIDSSLNAITGEYSPIFGRLNSIRNPAFNRLDVRVEKQWKFTGWQLALYLDVQNVYNAENPEGIVYDYEYRRHTTIRGLPIIPILGLRGEL